MNVGITKKHNPELAHISLCSGYGGIDLALVRCLPGCRTVAYVEIEAFAVENLVRKMEAGELDEAPVWTDLKTFPFHLFHGKLGIISGGFPCQPFSHAGKRAGTEDPRHLFPYIVKGIVAARPLCVFLENVEGIISAKLKGDGWNDQPGTPVLLHVIRELERVGYRATAGIFSAEEIGAPQRRKRVFIMAHDRSSGCEYWLSSKTSWEKGKSTQPGNHNPRLPFPARQGKKQHPWEPPRVV